MTKNMAEITRQVELARASHDHKELVQELTGQIWDQTEWMRPSPTAKIGGTIMEEGTCGTACCIAGSTVMHAGARLVGLELEWDDSKSEYKRSTTRVSGSYVEYNGKIWMIENLAKELLGLTWEEANELFDGDNTIAMLESIVKDWSNEQ